MLFFNVHPLGIFLGIFAIICGIIWILRKDKLKQGLCKNWPNIAFYVWGITAFISGLLVVININLLNYIIAYATIVLFLLFIIIKKLKDSRLKKYKIQNENRNISIAGRF